MIQLAFIGFLEAVVYLLRYRSATGKSHWLSGLHSLMIATLRVWFILAGVSAAMRDANPVALVVAYAGTAAVTTTVLHWWLEHRKMKGTTHGKEET